MTYPLRRHLTLGSVALVLVLAACTASSGGSSAGGGVANGDGGRAPGSSSGTNGSSGTAAPGGVLPATTFLFLERTAKGNDVLMAWDVGSNTRSVVNDLTGDGSEGWDIGGYAISEDRRSIAIASLYGPTKEDNDTGYAGRSIHVMNADGTNVRRLTPTWTARADGRSTFTVEVRDPAFSRDGSEVFFNYGEYWYEGTSLKGASSVWAVPIAGGLPSLAWPLDGCSQLDPAPDPTSDRVAVHHSVCIEGAREGLWLHARDGSSETKLVGGGSVRPSLETVSWAKDGSGFVFVGTTERDVGGSTVSIRGLFAYDDASKQVVDLVLPTEPDAVVMDGTLAPDGSGVIYCLRVGTGDTAKSDLWALDLSTNPPSTAQLTNDGVSCYPRW